MPKEPRNTQPAPLLAMNEEPPTTGVIPWYQSRTIWLQIVAIIFALGAKFDWWPKDISQEQAVTAAMVGVGILTAIFRWGPTPDVQLRKPE